MPSEKLFRIQSKRIELCLTSRCNILTLSYFLGQVRNLTLDCLRSEGRVEDEREETSKLRGMVEELRTHAGTQYNNVT